MFVELSTLVRASEKVVFTLAMHGDTMSVVVMPVVKNAGDPSLAAPLAISGSPADLDGGFVQALESYTTTRRSLVEQVEATTSILEAAKASQSSKATKALSKAAAKSDAAGSDGAEPDDRDDSGDEAAAPATASASPAPSTGTDLASLL